MINNPPQLHKVSMKDLEFIEYNDIIRMIYVNKITGEEESLESFADILLFILKLEEEERQIVFNLIYKSLSSLIGFIRYLQNTKITMEIPLLIPVILGGLYMYYNSSDVKEEHVKKIVFPLLKNYVEGLNCN